MAEKTPSIGHSAYYQTSPDSRLNLFQKPLAHRHRKPDKWQNERQNDHNDSADEQDFKDLI